MTAPRHAKSWIDGSANSLRRNATRHRAHVEGNIVGMRFTIANVLLLMTVTLAACTAPADNPARSRNHASLVGRPTLPKVVSSYETMLRELRGSLSVQLGERGWSTRPASTPTALCQEFGTEADTGLRTLPFILHDRFVPGQQWEQAVTTIERVAGRHGFNDSARVVDRPDEHRLALEDRYGAELTIQDGPRLLSIGLITGCHLRS